MTPADSLTDAQIAAMDRLVYELDLITTQSVRGRRKRFVFRGKAFDNFNEAVAASREFMVRAVAKPLTFRELGIEPSPIAIANFRRMFPEQPFKTV